jgi:hypothetical protein
MRHHPHMQVAQRTTEARSPRKRSKRIIGASVGKATQEEPPPCSPLLAVGLRKWDILETHIATLAEGGYNNAADFGMFLDSPGLERLFAKMEKAVDGVLNETNRQTLLWFHYWLAEQNRAKIDLETIDLEVSTRKKVLKLSQAFAAIADSSNE